MITYVFIAGNIVCLFALGARAWLLEDRLLRARRDAVSAERTVLTQREVIEGLERRVRDLGLRNRLLAVEVRGSDPTAPTQVMSTALPHPNQWEPEPWQVRP